MESRELWMAAGDPDQLEHLLSLCTDMRLYDDVVCLPAMIKLVEFDTAFGEPGQFKTWEYLLLAGLMANIC
ncbi:TPA: hypothetical protein ACH3X1_013048 [Trebouxia sp. C0004]